MRRENGWVGMVREWEVDGDTLRRWGEDEKWICKGWERDGEGEMGRGGEADKEG